MNEELEKANEQNKQYKAIKDKILEKQKNLINTNNELQSEEEKLLSSRIEIEDHIQHFKDKIEEVEKANALQNNSKTRLNKDDLSQKCKKTIEQFLIVKEKDNTNNMQFKIEFNGSIIIREIEDENMTFKRLKIFFKQQFNKSEKDFYFSDINERIYTDDMNIRRALFPFSSVLIKGYIPVIKVVEKIKKIQQVEASKEMEDGFRLRDIFSFRGAGGKFENFNKYLKKIKFTLISCVLFVIFLWLWIQSCRSFVNIGYYNNFLDSLRLSNIFKSDIEDASFLNGLRTNLINTMQFPTEQELRDGILWLPQNLNLFNQLNKNLESIRLIQTRYKSQDCTNVRISKEVLKGKNCQDTKAFDINPWIINNTTYSYFKDPYNLQINGILGSYDNSGYYADVTINFPEIFYQEIDSLIKSNWVDDKTASVILVFNIYNPSINFFITMRALYENMGGKLKNIDTQFFQIEMESGTDAYLVFSAIFSIIILINFLFILKIKPENDSKQIENVILIDKGPCRKLRNIYKGCIKFIKTNYRAPNKFELITLITMLFYYIALFVRSGFHSQVSKLHIDPEKFTDLSKYFYLKTGVVNFNCIIILFFFFGGVVMHLIQISEDIKVIADSMVEYVIRILPFSFFFSLPFFLIFIFAAYFLFGDFYSSYYKSFVFVGLKVIQSFLRGSLDNVGTDTTIEKDVNMNDDYFENATRYSVGPFNSIVDKVGYSAFILYSVTFWICANLIIRVVHTSYFLIAYRGKYLALLEERMMVKKK